MCQIQFTCALCGDRIFVGDEYYHNPEKDENYHPSCANMDAQLLKNLYLRYREN